MSEPSEELIAAYKLVESMLMRADGQVGPAPFWFGWALREAYLAGRKDEREDNRKFEIREGKCDE